MSIGCWQELASLFSHQHFFDAAAKVGVNSLTSPSCFAKSLLLSQHQPHQSASYRFMISMNLSGTFALTFSIIPMLFRQGCWYYKYFKSIIYGIPWPPTRNMYRESGDTKGLHDRLHSFQHVCAVRQFRLHLDFYPSLVFCETNQRTEPVHAYVFVR